MRLNACSNCGSTADVVRKKDDWSCKCSKCKNKSATCNYSLLAIEEWNQEQERNNDK